MNEKKRYIQLLSSNPFSVLIIFLFILSISLVSIQTVNAQEKDNYKVQKITGEIVDTPHFYSLRNMKEGDTLYVYMQRTSKNLDPFVAITDSNLGIQEIQEQYIDAFEAAINAGEEPLNALPEISNKFFLAWDDDSGEGYAAALQFKIPKDGDYQLIAMKALQSDTFGNYELLVGINSPEVLTGKAKSTEDTIAVLDQAESKADMSVQKLEGKIPPQATTQIFDLEEIEKGDVLYVYVDPNDDWTPVIYVADFGGKHLESANVSAHKPIAKLQYTFPETAKNYQLIVESCCNEDTSKERTFNMLVGLNSPDVLKGNGEEVGAPVVNEPVEVKVGIFVSQIVNVDQKGEKYEVVANVKLDWMSKILAFSPDTCNCSFKAFTSNKFGDFIKLSEGLWPEFSVLNQQGNRWIQNQAVVVYPSGKTIVKERFTATMQAPDFDFRKFPFDTQKFNIKLYSVFPTRFAIYTPDEGFSGFGEQLGEEEWVIIDYDMESNNSGKNSIVSLNFEAKRHLMFYLVRIFIPLILIIIVAWITFFLEDYGKRVDATTANLLLFIAFNFTISNDLPKLGYLTFLDTLLLDTFIISVLVVMFNVVLKRMQLKGKDEQVAKLDKYTLWIYPIIYVVSFGIITLVTFT